MMEFKSIVMIGIILATMVSMNTALAQSEGWYPGKGLEEGLLVKYRVSELDLTKGETVVLTIWFRDQDSNGNWNAYMIIEDQGKVGDGWVTLSSNLSPQGFVEDPELNKAREIFKKTLLWPGSYASLETPRPLSVGSIWGRTGVIGGVDVLIRSQERIEAAGKTWDTSILGWRYGRDNSIWIADNFPLPIRAFVYASTTQEPIPVLFTFDLVESRITDTKPEPPKEITKLPEPPLVKQSTTRTYTIELWWHPTVIQPGETIKIAPVIKSATGLPLQNVKYNITIADSAGNLVLNEEVTAERGTHTHEVVFNQEGVYKVTVALEEVTALGGVTGEIGIVEFAVFDDLVVVPEFPLGAVIVMASIVALVITISRFKQINLLKI